MRAENDRAFTEDGVFRSDYRMFSKDGRTLWLHDEARLVYDTSGKAMFWQGVVHDITEQKEAEQRLHEAEQR